MVNKCCQKKTKNIFNKKHMKDIKISLKKKKQKRQKKAQDR